jgi:hypothetical protein
MSVTNAKAAPLAQPQKSVAETKTASVAAELKSNIHAPITDSIGDAATASSTGERGQEAFNALAKLGAGKAEAILGAEQRDGGLRNHLEKLFPADSKKGWAGLETQVHIEEGANGKLLVHVDSASTPSEFHPVYIFDPVAKTVTLNKLGTAKEPVTIRLPDLSKGGLEAGLAALKLDEYQADPRFFAYVEKGQGGNYEIHVDSKENPTEFHHRYTLDERNGQIALDKLGTAMDTQFGEMTNLNPDGIKEALVDLQFQDRVGPESTVDVEFKNGIYTVHVDSKATPSEFHTVYTIDPKAATVTRELLGTGNPPETVKMLGGFRAPYLEKALDAFTKF